MKKQLPLKLTNRDYRTLLDFAKQEFIEKAKHDLSDGEFIARCYFLASVRLLAKHGVKIEVEEDISRTD